MWSLFALWRWLVALKLRGVECNFFQEIDISGIYGLPEIVPLGCHIIIKSRKQEQKYWTWIELDVPLFEESWP